MKEPWRFIDARHIVDALVPGTLDADTIRALHWATRDFHRGRGEVVEFGPEAGQSTLALARGLSTNRRRGDARVWSFDSFLIDDGRAHLTELFAGVDAGFRGSFYELFLRSVDPVAPLCRPCREPSDEPWERPIEVLRVRGVEGRPRLADVFDRFFTNLLDGALVVLEDLYHPACYALPVLTAALQPELLFLGRVGPIGGAFVVRDPRRFGEGFDALVPEDEELSDLLDQILQFLGGRATELGQLVAAQKLCLEARLRGVDGALEELHSLCLSLLSDAVRDRVVAAVLRSEEDAPGPSAALPLSA